MTGLELEDDGNQLAADVPRETSAQLVGAAAYAGSFSPVPVVAIDGVDVASGPGGAGGLMAVDGLSITWGREDVLDQPTPATARLSVFDPSRTWATAADRRGRPVTIRYQGTDPITGAAVSAVMFRGRIGSPVTVSRRDVVDPSTGQLVRGSLVELPLQSVVVDLANIVPRTGWPVETLGARVDRCVALAQSYGLLTGGANVRDYWKPPNVAPVAKKDQVSLLDHLTLLFSSAGADSYTYRPDTDALVYLPRRNYPSAVATGRLFRSTVGPRANRGAYVRATAQTFGAGDTETATGLYLDAGTLEYDPADGVTTPARITRVAITNPDEGDATPYTSRTVEQLVRREPWDPAGGSASLEDQAVGIRTAKIDSAVAWNSWADLALSDTEQLVRREGSRWLLAPLRLVTRKSGGFSTAAIGQLLLAGCEVNDLVFLQRSWLPELGIRPVYGVMGGVIRYARGGWDVEFQPAPITTVAPQHQLTWKDLQTTDPALHLKWRRGVTSPDGVDPTVVYRDLRYVGMGLDGITLPASSRDEYQT